MSLVAMGWLVLELTDSPAALGLTGAFAALPLIALALVGGLVADRVDRYRMILTAQLVSMVPDVVLAVLVGTGLVQVGHIYLYALANSTVRGFATPARQAFVPSLVPREALLSAIALNSILWQGAAVVGPALAGLVLSQWGTPWNFYLNVASDALNIALLLALRVPAVAPRPSGRSPWEGLVAGVRYLREQPSVRALLLAAAGLSFFGYSYMHIMPVFARDVLAVGPTGLGLLMTMPAAGTICAALSLALAGTITGKGRLYVVLAGVFALALEAFAASRVFGLSLVILLLVGAAGTATQTLGSTLLQHTVADRMRGRMVSFWIIATQGAGPLGAVPAGLMAQAWGAPAAVALNAAVVLVLVLALALARPGLRDLS
jgi:hypothetical protein